MKNIYLYFVMLCVAFSCHDDSGTVQETIMDDLLTGTWLRVEYGYSPGSGYITNTVPEVPPQTLQLEGDLSMTTNIEWLTKYKFYRILYDTGYQLNVIAFFEADPGSGPLSVSNLEHSYNANWGEGSLTLAYRWCIEGCHERFRKISNVQTD